MSIDEINSFLFMAQENNKSDLIFIPGSSEISLAEAASVLYERNISSIIFISGGENKKIDLTEARYLKDYLVKEKNIPSESIYIEEKATNTLENAIFSKNIIDELNVKSMTIVCKNYHSKRVFLTFSKVFNQIIYMYPIIDSRNITATNWFSAEEKKLIVLSELTKIEEYFKDE